MFYHPPTQRVLLSDDYRLDPSLAARPAFGLAYEGGLFFNKYENLNNLLCPSRFAREQDIFVRGKDKFLKGKILTIPAYGETIYTVRYHTSGSLHQHDETDLFETNPFLAVQENNPPTQFFPPWIIHGAACTLFRPEDSKPRHGTLITANGHWYFRPGRSQNNNLKFIPNFVTRAFKLVNQHILFQGHPRFASLIRLRQTRDLSCAIATHVSAAGLYSHDVPTLVKHKSLNPKDKEIWDEAYAEEYKGLLDLPCWVTISESEYKQNRHKLGRLLPTMAISTIKYDEFGKPKRAKYRIVALGNQEQHPWLRSDMYASVMNLLEVQILTALCVRNKCTLKSRDVKQAFCQATLPDNKQYVLCPPPGCPLTPPNSYWLLKRTLYGLRRSPRHWFNRATKLLCGIGMTPLPHAPCIFVGTLIPGEPPLYLGLYVDDFIYFSASDAVEKKFKKDVGAATNVDLMGRVSHFLGIRFQWRVTNDNVAVHLSQQAFAEALINQCGLSTESATTKPTPYRSGHPVDSVPHISMSTSDRDNVRKQLQSLVGSLLWLSQGIRPDLATITSILAQHQGNPSPGHVGAAKHAIKYLKGTVNHGICFHSGQQITIQSFVHFHLKRLNYQEYLMRIGAHKMPQTLNHPHPLSISGNHARCQDM